MARLKHFAHSVLSGYALLGANILYSLAAVPLAMRYLSTDEFGLWAVSAQIAAYLALVDMGVSSAIARLLVDHKDDVTSGAYGSLIKTGWMVLTVQAILLLPIGGAGALFLGPLLHIPSEFRVTFAQLILWQAALQAGILSTRIFAQILIAHQRQDLVNYGQILWFASAFILMTISLQSGLGVFSMILGQSAGLFLNIGFIVWFCLSKRLLPSRGHWGHISGKRFREMFSFSKDVFLMALGAQFIGGSQTIIVTRALGLDAAAVWSICNQTYNVVSQLVWKPYDAANMPLSEMAARGERQKLFERFRSLTVFTSSWAVLGAVLFALCNQSFIHVWTSGRIGWSPVNDVLLAGWLVIRTVLRCHSGFSAIHKEIGGMKFIYFSEGVFFLALAFASVSFGGFTAIILSSIAASLLFSYLYGVWRTSRYFDLPYATVALEWLAPALRLSLAMIPLGLALWYLAKPFDGGISLALKSGVALVAGLWSFWRWGLDGSLQEELRLRLVGLRKRLPVFLQ